MQYLQCTNPSLYGFVIFAVILVILICITLVLVLVYYCLINRIKATAFQLAGYPTVATYIWHRDRSILEPLRDANRAKLLALEATLDHKYPPVTAADSKRYSTAANFLLAIKTSKTKNRLAEFSSVSLQSIQTPIQPTSRNYTLLLFSICVLSASALTFVQNPRFYTTAVKQGEYMAAAQVPLSSAQGYQDSMTSTSFQLPVGYKTYTVDSDTVQCNSTACRCTVRTSMSNIQLTAGAVIPVVANCGNFTADTYIRIVTVTPKYTYDYQYSSPSYTWKDYVYYDCGQYLPAGVSPNSVPTDILGANGWPHYTRFYLLKPLYSGQCCTVGSFFGNNQGMAFASADLQYSDSISLHVFKARYVGTSVVYCLLTTSSYTVNCYQTDTVSPYVNMNIGTYDYPNGFTVGVYVVDNTTVKVVRGQFSQYKTPVWHQPGDVQFVGYDSKGYPRFPAIWQPAGVGISDIVARYSTSYSTPHDCVLIDFQEPVPGISLVESNIEYAPFQTNDYGLRVRNINFNLIAGIPTLDMPVEYTGSQATAVVSLSITTDTSFLQIAALTFGPFVVDSCNLTVGDTIGNTCVLHVIWLNTKNTFLITVTTSDMQLARPTGSFIISPALSTYPFRLNVFGVPSKLTFSVAIQGALISTSTTSDIVYTIRAPIQETGSVLSTYLGPAAQGGSQSTAAPSAVDNTVIIVIVVIVIIAIIALVVLFFCLRAKTASTVISTVVPAIQAVKGTTPAPAPQLQQMPSQSDNFTSKLGELQLLSMFAFPEATAAKAALKVAPALINTPGLTPKL